MWSFTVRTGSTARSAMRVSDENVSPVFRANILNAAYVWAAEPASAITSRGSPKAYSLFASLNGVVPVSSMSQLIARCAACRQTKQPPGFLCALLLIENAVTQKRRQHLERGVRELSIRWLNVNRFVDVGDVLHDYAVAPIARLAMYFSKSSGR